MLVGEDFRAFRMPRTVCHPSNFSLDVKWNLEHNQFMNRVRATISNFGYGVMLTATKRQFSVFKRDHNFFSERFGQGSVDVPLKSL